MATIEIKINMGGLQKTKVPTDLKDLVNTADAVRAGTLLGQQTWMEYISGVNVSYSGGTFSLSRQSGQYQQARLPHWEDQLVSTLMEILL